MSASLRFFVGDAVLLLGIPDGIFGAHRGTTVALMAKGGVDVRFLVGLTNCDCGRRAGLLASLAADARLFTDPVGQVRPRAKNLLQSPKRTDQVVENMCRPAQRYKNRQHEP